jgi:hypothetical protein
MISKAGGSLLEPADPERRLWAGSRTCYRSAASLNGHLPTYRLTSPLIAIPAGETSPITIPAGALIERA